MKCLGSVLCGLLCLPLGVFGQLTYHDAAQFPLLGRAGDTVGAHYVRLPDSLMAVTRKPLQILGVNSSGLAVRFRSNSTTIAARWTTRKDYAMNHMTPTGTKGLDLYAWINGGWRFVNSARPSGKTTETTIVANMLPQEREYMLYLPLYDGVEQLALGVDSLAEIGMPALDFPVRKRPVVCYGTSILQGGCANRAGMAHTNIISRRLNREVINLGFSGNAFLDYEIARLMSEVDAGVYVLDFVPNTSAAMIDEKGEAFFRILRDRRPSTPIIFIEDPHFTHALFDQRMAREVADKNAALGRLYRKLKQQGEKNIRLISSDRMLGDDGEATVDGIHFTDLGMMRYADLVCPVIQKMLKNRN